MIENLADSSYLQSLQIKLTLFKNNITKGKIVSVIQNKQNKLILKIRSPLLQFIKYHNQIIPTKIDNIHIMNSQPSLENFDQIAVLGKGSYAKVVLVRRKDDNTKTYAMKILKKKYIELKKQEIHVMI